MEEELSQEQLKISLHEFYFETPLYRTVEISNIEGDIFRGDINAYNPYKGFETTYSVYGQRVNDYSLKNYYIITLTCKRSNKSELYFFVYINDQYIIKIGQLPSLADIQFAEIGKRYDRFLSEEDLREYKKAIGLAAHGIGAGSFVYLRRIFENLINEAFSQNKINLQVDEKDFKVKKMLEKVELIKEFLPSQLVEMKNVYAVLSKGVHELSEEECLLYFPALKLSIELILDQKIESEIKRKKDTAVKNQIQAISSQIKKDT